MTTQDDNEICGEISVRTNAPYTQKMWDYIVLGIAVLLTIFCATGVVASIINVHRTFSLWNLSLNICSLAGVCFFGTWAHALIKNPDVE